MMMSPYNSGNLNQFKRMPPPGRLGEDYVLESGNTYANIRTRFKSLVRNNWAATAAVDTMVDYTCSHGGLTAVGGTDRAKKIWADWISGTCDASDEMTWIETLAGIVSGACEGDVGVHITSNTKLDDNTAIATRVSIIDGASIQTPSDFIAKGRNPITNNMVRLGIEYDVSGRSIAFWCRKDYTSDKFSNSSEMFRRIPRRDSQGRTVMMLFRNQNRRMVMQGRGLPLISASTSEIEDLADLANSAIKRAEVTSKLGVIARTAKPQRLGAALGGKNSDGTPTKGTSEEGRSTNVGQVPDGGITILPLDDGQIETISHTGNIDLVALMENGVRNFCAGTGIPKEILMSNFSGINFSSGKLSFDKFFRKLGRWEKALAIVTKAIRDVVITEGLLIHGIFATAEDYVVDAWIGAPRPDPNPAQTASADSANLQNGTDFKTLILAERKGMSYEQAGMIARNEKATDDKLKQEDIETGTGAEAVQDTALNGAQVSSLVEIVTAVTTGILPKDSAKAVVASAFPNFTEQRINEIIDPIQVKKNESTTATN